jgi:hypothetical protein
MSTLANPWSGQRPLPGPTLLLSASCWARVSRLRRRQALPARKRRGYPDVFIVVPECLSDMGVFGCGGPVPAAGRPGQTSERPCPRLGFASEAWRIAVAWMSGTVVRSQPAGGRPWASPRSMILIVGVPATDGWAHRVIMIADRQNLFCGHVRALRANGPANDTPAKPAERRSKGTAGRA